MEVKPIPDGYHTITPYLDVQGADKFIEFLERAFDAQILERLVRPNGDVANASIQIGDSIIMLSESRGDNKPAPASFYLYVPAVDATYKKLIEAGGTSLMEPIDTFYGNRESGVKDIWGNSWWVATHIEDVSEEEMQRRENARQQTAG